MLQHISHRQLPLPEGNVNTVIQPDEVALDVVFGSPSKQCDGVGICMLVESIYLPKLATKCPHFTGFFRFDSESGKMYARFPGTLLASQMHFRHFTLGLFKVTEPYKVPVRICRMLGLESNYKIDTGVYPVVAVDGDYVIVFGNPKVAL